MLQVSMAEFMSDEDLEALKADTNVEMPASAQNTNGQVQNSIEFARIGLMHKQHYVIPNTGGITALRCPLQVNRLRATSLHAKDQAAVLCKIASYGYTAIIAQAAIESTFTAMAVSIKERLAAQRMC